jgi:hypothetical protein
MNGQLSISDSLQITGTADLVLFEKTNPYYELIQDSGFINQLIGGGFSANDISSADIINNAQTRSNLYYQFSKNDSLSHYGEYYFLDIPVCKQGAESWHIHQLNRDRKSDFEIPFPLNEQYSFTISLPKDMKLINPVEMIEQTSDIGEVVISNIQNDTAIIVKRMLKISRQEIPVSSYSEFKQKIDIWNEDKYRRLVLRKD